LKVGASHDDPVFTNAKLAACGRLSRSLGHLVVAASSLYHFLYHCLASTVIYCGLKLNFWRERIASRWFRYISNTEAPRRWPFYGMEGNIAWTSGTSWEL